MIFGCSYFLGMLMSLMRGPQVEEPVEENKEEEKIGPSRMLPALPPTPEETDSKMQMFGLDITKEDNGQYVLTTFSVGQFKTLFKILFSIFVSIFKYLLYSI